MRHNVKGGELPPLHAVARRAYQGTIRRIVISYSAYMISKEKLAFAKKLKRNPTRGERVLNRYMWIVGYKAQAYDPTGFLPDYYSSVFRVAVEVDGSVHRGEQKRHDQYKDKVRRGNKIYTLRVSDDYAYWCTVLVLIEALLTGVIYRIYRAAAV